MKKITKREFIRGLKLFLIKRHGKWRMLHINDLLVVNEIFPQSTDFLILYKFCKFNYCKRYDLDIFEKMYKVNICKMGLTFKGWWKFYKLIDSNNL